MVASFNFYPQISNYSFSSYCIASITEDKETVSRQYIFRIQYSRTCFLGVMLSICQLKGQLGPLAYTKISFLVCYVGFALKHPTETLLKGQIILLGH